MREGKESMNIGPGLFLVSLGAVMAFAVNYPTDRVDVTVVGWILMAAGAVMIRLDLLEFVPRRRGTCEPPVEADPSATTQAALTPAPAAAASPPPAAAASAAPAPAAAPSPAPAASTPAPAPAAPAPAPVPPPRQSVPAQGPAGSGTTTVTGQTRIQWPEGVRRA
jgi:hypothetical protein